MHAATTSRCKLLQLSAWMLSTTVRPPLPAAAATVMSVCRDLDDSYVSRNVDGFHKFDVSCSAPGFDGWCAVTVHVQTDDIEYLWLKDASTPLARRIFAAKKIPYGAVSGGAELTQQLKVGYRVKPLSYCRSHGLYEGEAFVVDGQPTGHGQATAGSWRRTGSVAMAATADVDTIMWTLGLILVAYTSGYASEGYEPHRL